MQWHRVPREVVQSLLRKFADDTKLSVAVDTTE